MASDDLRIGGRKLRDLRRSRCTITSTAVCARRPSRAGRRGRSRPPRGRREGSRGLVLGPHRRRLSRGLPREVLGHRRRHADARGPRAHGEGVRRGPRRGRRRLRRGPLGARAAPHARAQPRRGRGCRAGGHRSGRGCRGRPRSRHPRGAAAHRAAHNDNARDIAELAVSWRRARVVGFDLAGPRTGSCRSGTARRSTTSRAVLPHHRARGGGGGTGIHPLRSARWTGAPPRSRRAHRQRPRRRLARGRGGAGHLRRPRRWVRDREITLELSPTSNLQSGAVTAWGDTMDAHPFDLLYQLDFSVTVNVDNRLMSATTLTRELGLLAQAFEYDLDDLEAFQLNAPPGPSFRWRSARSSSRSSRRVSSADARIRGGAHRSGGRRRRVRAGGSGARRAKTPRSRSCGPGARAAAAAPPLRSFRPRVRRRRCGRGADGRRRSGRRVAARETPDGCAGSRSHGRSRPVASELRSSARGAVRQDCARVRADTVDGTGCPRRAAATSRSRVQSRHIAAPVLLVNCQAVELLAVALDDEPSVDEQVDTPHAPIRPAVRRGSRADAEEGDQRSRSPLRHGIQQWAQGVEAMRDTCEDLADVASSTSPRCQAVVERGDRRPCGWHRWLRERLDDVDAARSVALTTGRQW